MTRLPHILALAAMAAIFVPSGTVSAKDDAAKLKKAREKVRKDIVEKKKGFPFFDLRYYVDAAKLKDSRWSHESHPNKDHKGGVQLHAKWDLGATAAGTGLGIQVIVIKHLHKDQQKNVTYSVPFKHWGESVPSANMPKIVEGYYEDWKRQAKDVIESDSQKPKKKSVGEAKLWAAVVGTNPETNEREYRAWYGWTHGKDQATYICRVRVGAALLKKDAIIDKSVDFVKAIKEVKGKVKW